MDHLTIEDIPIDRLSVSPFNVRRQVGDVSDLAASIQGIGLLQPIVVRLASGGGYEVVAGARRLEACRTLGWRKIPAIIRPLTDREALILSLSENIQQETLDPIERAEGVQRLVDDLAREMPRTRAIEIAADQIGKAASTIHEWLSLLRTIEGVQQMVRERKIESKVAARLASLPPEKQEPLAQILAEEDLDRASALRVIHFVQEQPSLSPEEAVSVFREEVLEEYTINVSMPGQLYSALVNRAREERCSIQEIVRRAVQAYLAGK